ncbi:MAG: bifunctional riboflavin kinase/FAD synthetase [Methylococcales bacterium]|nr:bifunctional riboflavin kinase/FAD synthetase [Methylococcales bacterium]MBT3698689.1 bifunctional riboflavin kinase/FAD synthetase [Methylococcales bacterium]MBT3815583.1 bifunctional riboflavin kinase/FAD synthetase [Methylococcales bacterium]MBT4031719.1 bifunctional riboflavin kinase/FAD synthetase [Methylococcales bacterium]MBT4348422.1 bifunctional riboflavin kinase/FAD synthetase [Methylococcales bacterium]
MRLIRGLSHSRTFPEGCVLTIGNFDGVHLGHQAVISGLAQEGVKLGLPVVIMLFEPQPLEYFQGDNGPARITRLREKILQLKRLPVDGVYVLRFSRILADWEPECFIQEVLCNRLNVKYLVVGDDFHFGKARRGTFSLLKACGQEMGFDVCDTQPFLIKGKRVSSTLIRDALAKEDLDSAALFLGRSFSVCGRVVHGDKRGRTLGFPTANIEMFRKIPPLFGVFAITLTGLHGQAFCGVANVGSRPTVSGRGLLLEVHLFDFDEDIYGRYVEVHFKKKIRDEKHFQSLEELKLQIREDVSVAKASLDY